EVKVADADGLPSGHLLRCSSNSLEPTPASTVVPSTSAFLTTGRVTVTLFASTPLLVVIMQVVSVTAPSKVIRPTSSAIAETEPNAITATDAAKTVFLNI